MLEMWSKMMFRSPSRKKKNLVNTSPFANRKLGNIKRSESKLLLAKD